MHGIYWIYRISLSLSSLSDTSCVFLRVLGNKEQAMVPAQHLYVSAVSLEFILVSLLLPTPHTQSSSCPITAPVSATHVDVHIQFIVQITPDLPISMGSPLSLQFMAGLTRVWVRVYFSSSTLKEM